MGLEKKNEAFFKKASFFVLFGVECFYQKRMPRVTFASWVRYLLETGSDITS